MTVNDIRKARKLLQETQNLVKLDGQYFVVVPSPEIPPDTLNEIVEWLDQQEDEAFLREREIS